MSRLDALRDDRAFRVWSHRVVYTTFLDRQDREARHRRRAEAGGEAVMVRFPGPAEREEQRRIGARITRAIALLAPERRAAVVLVDVDGMTFAEAAEVLGVKVGTVASRVARARSELRADLADLAREEGVIG
jgi:RNA polymerase sigma-70 factor (ECF subfamily)